jgi:hypothetical protein
MSESEPLPRSAGRGRTAAGTLLLAALLAAGCGQDAEREDAAPGQVALDGTEEPASAAPQEPWPVVLERVEQYSDSADRLLRRVQNLTGQENATLRQDVNARQLASAQSLARRVTSGIEPLVASGQLVNLAEDTPLWVVRELGYSVPYVTPDAHAMLEELGQRFHARLDSLGIPRFRLDITSVLRTPEDQARLRRSNRNAASTESTHEFGTTVDVAYRRFAPPADHPGAAVAVPELRAHADSLMIETGRLRGAELQAVLGRVLLEMRREGKLLVIMERSQTVYHMTVAKRLGGGGTVQPASADF